MSRSLEQREAKMLHNETQGESRDNLTNIHLRAAMHRSPMTILPLFCRQQQQRETKMLHKETQGESRDNRDQEKNSACRKTTPQEVQAQ
jgi:hypothetical protein